MGHETHGRRYLRARTEISSDKDGDISGQKRRYPPAKPYNEPTDKVHIGYNSANGYHFYVYPVFLSRIIQATTCSQTPRFPVEDTRHLGGDKNDVLPNVVACLLTRFLK